MRSSRSTFLIWQLTHSLTQAREAREREELEEREARLRPARSLRMLELCAGSAKLTTSFRRKGWEAMAYEIDQNAPKYDDKDLPESAVTIVDLMDVKEVHPPLSRPFPAPLPPLSRPFPAHLSRPRMP